MRELSAQVDDDPHGLRHGVPGATSTRRVPPGAVLPSGCPESPTPPFDVEPGSFSRSWGTLVP
jgi:hypothetical protein